MRKKNCEEHVALIIFPVFYLYKFFSLIILLHETIGKYVFYLMGNYLDFLCFKDVLEDTPGRVIAY